jgi:hypothetical protein
MLKLPTPESSRSSFPVRGIGQGEIQVTSATATGATFDQEEIKRIIIQWRLAEGCLCDPNNSMLSEHALRVLVRQDVPQAFEEVIRLRPDLAWSVLAEDYAQSFSSSERIFNSSFSFNFR